MVASRFRTPSLSEQQILDRVKIHLLAPEDALLRERFRELIEQHHYLKTDILVGQQLRYVAEVDGRWVALLSWSAAANHFKDREEWWGWNIHQRRRRLALVANNAKYLILPGPHCPNLATPQARAILSAAQLPAPLQPVEDAVIPRSDATVCEIRSLMILCRQIPDWRAKKGRDYPLLCLLAIMVMATRSGIVRGQRDLAAFAAKLTQFQLRALGSYRKRSGGRDYPKETTFQRILSKPTKTTAQISSSPSKPTTPNSKPAPPPACQTAPRSPSPPPA